ncbi:MAG TPA: phage holin family protein [Thermoanaerobaculia bacterium]|nr:phage holin family protein [Thermoanaerobaculia bacterium]
MLTAFRMSNYSETESGRSLGSIIKDLTADVSNLMRSEIALVKLEIKESVAKLGTGGVLLGAAAFLGLFGLAFLFVTITLGLVALGVPAWVSSLIVTLLLLVGAGVLAMMGKKKLQGVNFVPSDSIDHIKGDIDALKADVARVRSR